MMRDARRRRHAALLALLLPLAASAHELQANRVTLVQRDERHLSLTLYFDAGQALQRVMAPGARFDEFAAVHAAMAPEAFAVAVQRAQRQLQAQIRLLAADGRPLALQMWTWPPAAAQQASLQRHVMRTLTGGAGAEHDPPAEARAEATGTLVPRRLRIELPAALQPALVVAYRPRQAWSRSGAPAVTVELP